MSKLLSKLLIVSVLAVLVMPGAVFAQDPDATIPTDLPDTGTGILDTVAGLANWVFALIMVIVVFIVLWAAFQFLTSGGNPDAVTSARNKLLFAAIGIIIAMFALVFDDIVRNIVDVGTDT